MHGGRKVEADLMVHVADHEAHPACAVPVSPPGIRLSPKVTLARPVRCPA